MAYLKHFAAFIFVAVFVKSSTSFPVNSNFNFNNLSNMSPSASLTPSLTVSSPNCGCNLPAELVPQLQYGDINLDGDLPIGGTIKVSGCFPVYGTIAVDGNVPSSGTAVVNTSCGLPDCGCK